VAKYYELVNEQELKLFEMNIKNLNTFVTTKKEKEKQKNFSHMPKKDCISVKDYLFTVFNYLNNHKYKNNN
jgi:hypothetical protein